MKLALLLVTLVACVDVDPDVATLDQDISASDLQKQGAQCYTIYDQLKCTKCDWVAVEGQDGTWHNVYACTTYKCGAGSAPGTTDCTPESSWIPSSTYDEDLDY